MEHKLTDRSQSEPTVDERIYQCTNLIPTDSKDLGGHNTIVWAIQKVNNDDDHHINILILHENTEQAADEEASIEESCQFFERKIIEHEAPEYSTGRTSNTPQASHDRDQSVVIHYVFPILFVVEGDKTTKSDRGQSKNEDLQDLSFYM